MPHEVALRWRDGREETVSVDEGETVLSAAERAGVAVPFGCRHGACGTCTGRLREGSVTHRREPRVLDADEREAGYVLTCIAEPAADCVIEVGRAVRRDLYDNPWK
jgi:ferredoxin